MAVGLSGRPLAATRGITPSTIAPRIFRSLADTGGLWPKGGDTWGPTRPPDAPLAAPALALLVLQQRCIHQPRVRCVEDGPVLTPSSPAEESKDYAYDDEHEGHGHEDPDHGRVHFVGTLRWLWSIFAMPASVLQDANHFEFADAVAIAAFGLGQVRLALLVEETRLVDLRLFSTFCDMVRGCQVTATSARLLGGVAHRPGEPAFRGAVTTVPELERPSPFHRLLGGAVIGLGGG